jgi:hypothetical protein
MPKSSRKALLASIAGTIADYRKGVIPTPDSAHVDGWVSQFDASVQEPILTELAHVLHKTYIQKPQVDGFLSSLLTKSTLVGAKPSEFWRKANFLSIQGGGNSQREMLAMLDIALQKTCGLRIDQCGSANGPYIYLDDVIFTGNRIKNDVLAWILSSAPSKATLHVITIALHIQAKPYVEQAISIAAANARKTVELKWWARMNLENRDGEIENADVLRPKATQDTVVAAYIATLRHHVMFRSGTGVGRQGFFSSAAGRDVLEQEFLKAGVHIRSICPLLNKYQRPLGNMVLESLGFGALVVTFRNCANNCPLALWAGDPWYPLFPRKTN